MVQSYVVDSPQFALPSGVTTCKLRIYLDRTFLTGGSTGAGRQLQAGAPPTAKFYREIIVTIGTRVTPTGDTIPIATIAQFTIDSTTDGFDVKTAKYSAFFFSNTGSQLAPFGGFDRFSVPPAFDTGTTATWTQIRQYNQSGAPIFTSTDTYTKEVIDAKIAAIVGMTNPMTSMGDMIVGGMSGIQSRLPFSSSATPRFLKQTGTSTITTAFTSLASIDITTALAYTPVNKAGDTMTGLLTLSGAPTSALHAATKAYVDSVAGGITNLNGLTASSQLFAVGGNFPNLTISSVPSTHTFNWTGQLSAIRGGTGLSTISTGEIIYGSAADVYSRLAPAAAGNALLSGTTPTWGKIALTTLVSGILPGANGGTNNGFFQVTGPTASLKSFAFPDASATVLTTNAAVTPPQGGTGFTSFTTGDILYADSATTIAKRAIGASNTVLTVSAGVPAWSLVSLTASVSGVLPVANGGSGQSSFIAGFLKSNGTTISSQALLTVADGGTNTSSYAATNGVVYVGASSLLSTALGASGTILTGTGAAPAFTATPVIGTSLTISPLTANSIIFAGTAGLLSQNNTRFYWDNTALPSGGLNVQDAVIFRGATSGTVGLRAPGTLGDGSIYSLPATNGSNDQVLTILDATTKTLTWKSASSLMTGITTVNGEDGPVITLAVGSTGTDFAIAVTSDTVTFNLPSAGSGTRGLITSGTQTIFGAKTLNDPLTFPAGTTTTTPFMLQAGAVLTSAVAHSFEWDGSHAFYTQAGPTTRQQVAYTTAVGSETVALATNFAGNLTGDVTSVGMATTYNAVLSLAKGGLGTAQTIGAAGTFLRSDGALVGFSADGSSLTGLNASNIASGTISNSRLSGVELSANKDVASGYAGLTASTKLNLAQMQEVMASTDLSDFAAKNGTGTTILGTTITAPTNGEILTYQAGNWINSPAGAATAHDILSATHTDSLAAAVSEGSILIGNATPKWSELVIGGSNTVLRSNGTTASWSAVVLSTDVSGILSIANGGTGNSYASATALFNGVDPLTSKGDILTHNGTDSVRNGVGANGSIIVADSAQANGLAWTATEYRLSAVVVLTLTTAQTYTVPAGVRALYVKLIGGGGGGGGVDGVAARAAGGGGGGGGSYCEKFFTGLAASYSYQCGAGGAGGAAGLNNGVAGSNTTFSTLTGFGGAGGNGDTASAANITTPRGLGGAVATGGDLNLNGDAGFAGIGVITVSIGGKGGAGIFGQGSTGSPGNDSGGFNGGNYGAGGSGASCNTATDRAGGNGSQGVIIVMEYK